ncbi:hypothetical protein Hypma_010577 [Hypsizygus marmoreus]|uniref:Extracellular serine-rich protein n=1 Tax=Hypsizygus marmoreus TaxID=39966 RepID=A0A369JSE7_HYPMA|nr:hypothetical protein Hypma_010577 [Hypsizygus marmoreus]
MRFFSTAAVALASAAAVSAANLQVLVGDGGLTFTPPSVVAASGDIINFEFRSKNHSVTQSTFANPCQLQTTPNPGVDSGFQAVAAGATEFPAWSITIDDPSTPLWFFCAQTVPANHCKAGMVFAVNAPPDKSFDAFQANAKASNPSAPTPVPSASGTPSGVVPPATTGTGTGVSTSLSPTSTPDAPTNGTSAGADVNGNGNGALRLGLSAGVGSWSVLALLGLGAGLVL